MPDDLTERLPEKVEKAINLHAYAVEMESRSIQRERRAALVAAIIEMRAEAAERALEAANKDATTLLPADPAHDDCVVVLRSGINYIVAEKRAAERALAEERERRGHARNCECCWGTHAFDGLSVCPTCHGITSHIPDPRCAPPPAAGPTPCGPGPNDRCVLRRCWNHRQSIPAEPTPDLTKPCICGNPAPEDDCPRHAPNQRRARRLLAMPPCGTCGSDDPGQHPCDSVAGEYHSKIDVRRACPDAFHAAPRKETR